MRSWWRCRASALRCPRFMTISFGRCLCVRLPLAPPHLAGVAAEGEADPVGGGEVDAGERAVQDPVDLHPVVLVVASEQRLHPGRKAVHPGLAVAVAAVAPRPRRG